MGIANIAEKTGMSRSTTHRYVVTLMALELLEQPPSGSRKYRLAPKARSFGTAVLDTMPLRVEGRVFLEELRRQVSYTVSSAVLYNDEVLILDRLRGSRYARLKLELGPGSRLPAYCTSMGKMLLAHRSQDEQEIALRRMWLGKLGPNTITNRRALLEELAQVREAGFAVNDEELIEGVVSIAMPVRQGEVVIGAVDVAAHTSLVSRTQLVEECGPRLLRATQRMSSQLTSVPTGGVTPQ